jgi:hypothetical protein
MVGVVQLVERQVVILNVAGSSPVTHPIGQRVLLALWPFLFSASLHPYCRSRYLLLGARGRGRPLR